MRPSKKGSSYAPKAASSFLEGLREFALTRSLAHQKKTNFRILGTPSCPMGRRTVQNQRSCRLIVAFEKKVFCRLKFNARCLGLGFLGLLRKTYPLASGTFCFKKRSLNDQCEIGVRVEKTQSYPGNKKSWLNPKTGSPTERV